jgi:uncharacterized protein YukE
MTANAETGTDDISMTMGQVRGEWHPPALTMFDGREDGSMHDARFRVDLPALYRLAGELQSAAIEVRDQAGRFSSRQPGPGAFGLLPQAQSGYDSYLRKFEEALEGLSKVERTLLQDLSDNLRLSADTYRRADDASAIT